MPISDKTRKILWGRSGNRCAFCRHELVIDATTADDESVIGEECHILSRKGQGPRYDSSYPSEQLDEAENLILLCRIHHKMVDDQHETDPRLCILNQPMTQFGQT
jgi:predicted restriction endonuclease